MHRSGRGIGGYKARKGRIEVCKIDAVAPCRITSEQKSLSKHRRKYMEKKFRMTILALAAAMSLTACGSFTCDFCGQQKSGHKYTVEILGEKGSICKECHEGLNQLKSLFGY